MFQIIEELTKSKAKKDVTSNQVLSMGKVSRGPKNTNSSSEQFKSKQGIWCNLIRKAKKKKNTSRNYNRAKQACVNTVDPATHLKDAQCVERDIWNVTRIIIIEHCSEAWQRAVHKVEKEQIEEDGKTDMVNIDFINCNAKSPGIIAKLKTSNYQSSADISYKIDTGSNSNILFPRSTRKLSSWAKIRNTKLKTYNNKTIRQLWTCYLTLIHKEKQKAMWVFCSTRKWLSIVRHARYRYSGCTINKC